MLPRTIPEPPARQAAFAEIPLRLAVGTNNSPSRPGRQFVIDSDSELSSLQRPSRTPSTTADGVSSTDSDSDSEGGPFNAARSHQ